MRILSWVQNKFHGGEENKRFAHSPSAPDAQKEELKDWPQALLTIGTFGNTELKENPRRDDDHSRNLDPSKDLSDFFLEEVDKLQKELKRLMIRKSKSSSIGAEISEEEDRTSFPLNRFLNCPSNLEAERKMSLSIESLTSENNGDLSPNTKVILNKVKDLLLGNNHNAIKKKSISFLLKKMFVCHSGFAPARSLRDPIPESRIEKIIRAILVKKMYQQQNSTQTSSKKYLENKPTEKTAVTEEEESTKKDQCKWVKTDSNFIVLEI